MYWSSTGIWTKCICKCKYMPLVRNFTLNTFERCSLVFCLSVWHLYTAAYDTVISIGCVTAVVTNRNKTMAYINRRQQQQACICSCSWGFVTFLHRWFSRAHCCIASEGAKLCVVVKLCTESWAVIPRLLSNRAGHAWHSSLPRRFGCRTLTGVS